MKTRIANKRSLMATTLLCLMALFMVRCDQQVIDEPMPIDQVDDEEVMDLNDLLERINPETDHIIVQNSESIQEAVDVATSGSAIYIEPGEYHESIHLNEKNIQIIALGNNETEQVIVGSIEGAEIQSLHSDQLKRGRRHRITMERNDLGEGIAHYTFDITMGSGQFDVIRVHRVVKEYRPYRPVRTKGNIFMVHGGIQDFDDIFLTAGAEHIDATTSAPFYLATNKIDVWGIDMGWTKVPIETTDFSFMEGWGIEKDVAHTLKAMSIARLIRGFTRQGFGKMNLLGFSYGVDVAYSAAAHETLIHRICRDVNAIIPVDGHVKANDPDINNAECAEAESQWNLIASGQYHNPQGVGLIQLGGLAISAAHDPSPVPDFAGLTNIQVIMAIASSHAAGRHFLGGTPFALNYTDPMRFARLGVALAPYMPRLMFYEMAASTCPSRDISADDHLEDIRIPILFISAEGGVGPGEDYTASLTKSRDISRIHVKDPDIETQFNFGHADLWMAYEASNMVWEPLRQWLIEH